MLFLVVHEASEYGAVGDLDCCLNKTISVHCGNITLYFVFIGKIICKL